MQLQMHMKLDREYRLHQNCRFSCQRFFKSQSKCKKEVLPYISCYQVKFVYFDFQIYI